MNYTSPQNMQVGGMHTFVYYVPCTVFVTFSVPNKYVSLRCPRNAYGPAGADTSGAQWCFYDDSVRNIQCRSMSPILN